MVRRKRSEADACDHCRWDHFDIDTALDILASRDIECGAGVAEKLDLSHADLSALIYLPRANFRGFDLFASSLDDAYLAGSDLSNADLGHPQRLASLRNADLGCANLRNVTFVDSDEQVAALQDVHVWLANVRDVTPDRFKRLLLSLGARSSRRTRSGLRRYRSASFLLREKCLQDRNAVLPEALFDTSFRYS
jgi:hypothetical protein